MPNNDHKDNLHLRSEEVQEIVSTPPSWLIRWGLTLLFILVCLIILLSFMLKYPDYISAKVMVTTMEPTERLFTRKSGEIDKMFVQNGDTVTVGQYLAGIKSTADLESIMILKELLNGVQFGRENVYKFPIDSIIGLELGEIEMAFVNFERSYMEFKLLEKLQPFVNQLEGQKFSFNEAQERIKSQKHHKELLERKVALVKKDFDRNTKLFEEGAIAPKEFESKEIEYLQVQEQLNQMVISISQLQEAIINTGQSLKNTYISKEQDETRILNNLIHAYHGFKRAVKEWEQNYIISSSTEGVVSFQGVWAKNQFVNVGDHLMSIFPNNKSELVGKMSVPSFNSGKIKSGQQVLIKLDNYPYQQFGTMNGLITDISISPDNEGNYLIYTSLPNGSTTSYRKEILINKELLGTAEIITENLSVAERLFFRFKSMQRF